MKAQQWYHKLARWTSQGESARTVFFFASLLLVFASVASLSLFERIGTDPDAYADAPMLMKRVLYAWLPMWSICWAVLLWFFWNERLRGPGRGWANTELRSYFPLLIAALLVVLTLHVAPVLSDDIYRYLWEGNVIRDGFNPYLDAPKSPALAFVADRNPTIHSQVNHPHISAIYPPLPQYTFALMAILGMGIVGLRLLFVLLYGMMVAGCVEWLDNKRLPRGRALLLLLLPLFFFEVVVSGHLDVLVAFGLMLILRSLESRTSDGTHTSGALIGSIIGMSACVLSKLFPILLLPALVMQFKKWQHRLILVLAVPALCVAAYMPFRSAGWKLFSALDTYGTVWEYNSSLFDLFVSGWQVIDPNGENWETSIDAVGSLVGVQNASDFFLQTDGFYRQHPNQGAARMTSGFLLLAVLAATLIWRRRDPFDRHWLYVIGALFLLSPVVHPWYLLALLPALLRGGLPSLLGWWWVLTIPFSYNVLPRYWSSGSWRQDNWSWWLQYGGMAAIATAALVIYAINSNARRGMRDSFESEAGSEDG